MKIVIDKDLEKWIEYQASCRDMSIQEAVNKLLQEHREHWVKDCLETK